MDKKELLSKKVAIVTLGCDKNTVDSEKLAYKIKTAGFDIISEISKAQIVIINTCAFIENARKENIEMILNVIKYKEAGLEKIVVCGCLPQKHYDELVEELPEVDLFLKLNENTQIVKRIYSLYDVVYEKDAIQKNGLNRMLSTPNHYAYLKISDGCNNFCSYCTIPFIRGRYNSTPLKYLIDEAKSLVEVGVKEIILVAQNVTLYGSDLNPKVTLVDLIQELSKIKKLEWIRLHYCYPNLITDELLNEIDNNPKVCKYIDIPFQHLHNEILKNMNRKETFEDIELLVEKIRGLKNHISIRSTFMAGFPGEKHKHFKFLKRKLKQLKLNNVGFFAYSQEQGTRAGSMPKQIRSGKKLRRVKSLQKVQTKVLKYNQKQLIDKELRVLCDSVYDNETYLARTEYDSPGVDNVVYIFTKKPLVVGEFYKVQIVDTINDSDLVANLIKEKNYESTK